MVRSLAQGTNWRARINEGAVLEHLDRLLNVAEGEKPTGSQLASAFLAFATRVGSGFSKSLRRSLTGRLGETLNHSRTGINQKAWILALDSIYSDPSHRGLAAAMETVAQSRPDGYEVRLRDHAATLRALGQTSDPRGHLQALSRLRRRRTLPNSSESTVHKAKGLEFRRVLLCPVDPHQYPSSSTGARLLYVAMSRATHQLSIVIDTASPVEHLDYSGFGP